MFTLKVFFRQSLGCAPGHVDGSSRFKEKERVPLDPESVHKIDNAILY